MGFHRVVIAYVLFPLVAAATPTQISIADFGAKGDGVTLNTKSIQAAIDACGGGGTVHFPAGTFVSGTIQLRDHIRLDFDTGAVLLASRNVDDYPFIVCRFPSCADRYNGRALIWGEGLTDIAITGRGTIEGDGARFRDKVASEEQMKQMTAAYAGTGRYAPVAGYANRPYLIRLVSCRNVLVENITLRNSPMWMQHYLDCDFVTLRGVTVFNHGGHNNDMVDIDCCRDVVISGCVGDTDDDALTLKSTGAKPTERVVVSDCILRSHCNAIKAGTESSGGFKDITISNCVVTRSLVDSVLNGRRDGIAGIALEIVDGGTLDGVAISNVTIRDAPSRAFPVIPSRTFQSATSASHSRAEGPRNRRSQTCRNWKRSIRRLRCLAPCPRTVSSAATSRGSPWTTSNWASANPTSGRPCCVKTSAG
ncbi:MAG: glycoside hydrolase family 28 protein [Candidatus Hydrogenedentes bacterium]|nr:glycoside hydrolase family 28 protein [Candidatus Hydrogenedentota bacterium]